MSMTRDEIDKFVPKTSQEAIMKDLILKMAIEIAILKTDVEQHEIIIERMWSEN